MAPIIVTGRLPSILQQHSVPTEIGDGRVGVFNLGKGNDGKVIRAVFGSSWWWFRLGGFWKRMGS